MKNSKMLLLAVLALFMAACASTDIPDPDPDSGTDVDTSMDSANTTGADDGGLGDLEPIRDDSADTSAMDMVVYFGFDQSDVRSDDQATVAQVLVDLA